MNTKKIKTQPHPDTWKLIMFTLKEIALQKGITHQDIADATGLLRSNVTRIFAARYCPSLDMVVKVAAAVGVNIFMEDLDGTTDLSQAFQKAMDELGRRPEQLPRN
jgi:DNA-binding phage protein